MNIKQLFSVVISVTAAAVLAFSGSSYASKADDKIEASFRNTHVYKTYLKSESVEIKVKNGVATLTGTVAGDIHKTLAEDTAASLPGVRHVDNRLETKAEVSAENTNSWIEKKVKLALMFHRNVNADKTVVDVKDGIVTLRGEASSAAQKDLTAEYAGDISGVKAVQNEMTVKESPQSKELPLEVKMDDASIVAQVKAALSAHKSTSALKTKVETRNGQVTLTGVAKNEAEKSLVTKLVTDIQGVTKVKNKMTVEESNPK